MNIDNSHRRIGSMEQMTALTFSSAIEHDLFNKGLYPGTTVYTGKGQSEFPKVEKANLLRSSYSNWTS